MRKQKSYHHKDLKNQLIEKGIELVNEFGLASFSLRKVATACGVSHAAPYSHFQNKEELLEAIQNFITDEFSEKLQRAIEVHISDPNILERLGVAYVEFFIDNPHYFPFLYTQSNIVIDLSAQADGDNNYKPFEIYKGLVLGLMEKSGYPQHLRQDTVVALWSFIHGIASLATMKNVCYDADWRTKLADLLGVFNCSFVSPQ